MREADFSCGVVFAGRKEWEQKEIHRRWYFIRSTMLTRSGYVVIDDNDPAHIIRNNPHVIPPSRQVVRHKVPHQHGASDKITSCDVLRWHIFRTPDLRRLVFRTDSVGKVKFFSVTLSPKPLTKRRGISVSSGVLPSFRCFVWRKDIRMEADEGS